MYDSLKSAELDELIASLIALEKKEMKSDDNFPYNMCVVPAKYDEILDYLLENKHFTLSAGQIEFLLGFTTPPLMQNRDDFCALFGRVSKSARQTGDLHLIEKVYMRGLNLCRDRKDNPERAALLEDGIDYLLFRHYRQGAGKLCIKLAMEYDILGKRMEACERALSYLDDSSELYACALSVKSLLDQMCDHPGQKLLHYSVYGQRIILKNHAVLISPLTAHWWNAPNSEVPISLCLNSPLIKGYSKFLNSGYYGQNRVLTDNSGPIFRDLWRGDPVESHFVENLGLERMVYSDSDAMLEYEFELCDYRISGGRGFFPLQKGNIWHYKQVGCPDTVYQVITREITAQNGEEYILSGMDCIFFNCSDEK